MTPSQHTKLLAYISKYHSPFGKGKMVKYLDSTYDFRNNKYFHIKLRCLCAPDFELSLTNEDREKDLYDEVMRFLDS